MAHTTHPAATVALFISTFEAAPAPGYSPGVNADIVLRSMWLRKPAGDILTEPNAPGFLQQM